MKVNDRILALVNSRTTGSVANTRVEVYGESALVFLFETMIAQIQYSGTSWIARPVLPAFDRWPTRLTSNRLGLLGIKAHIVKGRAHIDGTPVSILMGEKK